MKPHEISSQYPGFNAEQTHKAHLSESPARPVPSANAEIPTSTWIVSGICSGIIIAIVLFLGRQIFTWQRKQGFTNHWDYHQHIPCHNCRFYSRSSYLRCAVHPTKAMRRAAIGCSDYWDRDSDRFSQ